MQKTDAILYINRCGAKQDTLKRVERIKYIKNAKRTYLIYIKKNVKAKTCVFYECENGIILSMKQHKNDVLFQAPTYKQ